MSIPWIERFRPHTIEEMVGVIDARAYFTTIVNQIAKDEPFSNQAIILHGPPGCGKTTLPRAFVHSLEQIAKKCLFHEINASDRTSSKTIVRQLRDEILPSKYDEKEISVRVILLDEFDSMERMSQENIIRLLEHPYPHDIFVITCNYMNKLPPSLRECERAKLFDLPPLSVDDITSYLHIILDRDDMKDVNTNCEKDGLIALIENAQGDIRRILNDLQATYLAYKRITVETVRLLNGLPSNEKIIAFIDYCCNIDIDHAIPLMTELLEEGFTVTVLTEQLIRTATKLESALDAKNTKKAQLLHFIMNMQECHRRDAEYCDQSRVQFITSIGKILLTMVAK